MVTPAVVVFDIDGTLMDHAVSARAGLESWLASLGHRITDELAEAWTKAEREHFTEWRDGRITFAEQRRRRLRDILPLLGDPVGSDADLDHVFDGYLTAYESAWRAYPDVRQCLQALRANGKPLAVLSNGSEEQQRKKLSLIGVAGYFAEVFTPEGLGVAKPQLEAFQATAKALDVAPEECLYVGDDYELDIVAARAADWQAIHLDRTQQAREADAITSLTGLPGLIR